MLPSWHLLLAVSVGAYLRLHAIGRQVLVDDEWHALHEVLHHSYRYFLLDDGWTPSGDHYSVPYALFDKLLAGTVGLTELGMRMPSLVAGIALTLLLPLLVRRHVSAQATAAWAYLLAISPLLVFFSRLARPYSPSLLLSFVAVTAFYAWLSDRSRAKLAVAVASAGLAALLHASVAPLLFAPVLYALLRARLGATRERSRPLAVAAAVSALAFLLIVLPYLASPVSLQRVLFHDPPSWHTVVLASELWLGTRYGIVVLVLLALAVIGLAPWDTRARSRFVDYLVFVAGVQVAAMVLLSPRGFKFGIVFARFCLFAQPVLLLLVALGIERLARRLVPRGEVHGATVAAGLCALLYAGGPLPRIDFYPNAFTNHGSWQCDYDTERYFDLFAPRCIPPLYLALARLPAGTLGIVEAPWYFYWHSFAFYQRLDRQRVLIGFVDENPDEARVGEVPRNATGIRLRNAVHVADYAELARRGVDLVVLHKDLLAEMKFPFAAPPVSVARWLPEYRSRFGPPLYEDAHVAAYFVGSDRARRAELEAALSSDAPAVAPDLPVPVCDARPPAAAASLSVKDRPAP